LIQTARGKYNSVKLSALVVKEYCMLRAIQYSDDLARQGL